MANFLRYLGATDAIGQGTAQLTNVAMGLRQLQNQEAAGRMAAQEHGLTMAAKGLQLKEAQDEYTRLHTAVPLSTYTGHLPEGSQNFLADVGRDANLLEWHGDTAFITPFNANVGLKLIDSRADLKKKFADSGIQGLKDEATELLAKGPGNLNDKEAARLKSIQGMMTQFAVLSKESQGEPQKPTEMDPTHTYLDPYGGTIHQAVAKPEDPFGKIDTKDYTSPSVSAYQRSITKENPRGDRSLLEPLDKNISLNKKYQIASDLRDRFLKESQTFKDVRDAYARIEEGSKNPSAAGDLSLVFAYMKMLDPGSTVREGEQASASNAVGIPDKIRNIYNRINTGEKLTIDQRADFVGRSKQLFSRQEAQHKQREDFYTKRADAWGISRADVVEPLSDPMAGTVHDQLPDPAQHTGKIARDTVTGKRYQSDGQQWVEVQ